MAAFTSSAEVLRSGFGTLARLEVSDALSVDFCFLPSADAARPDLWDDPDRGRAVTTEVRTLWGPRGQPSSAPARAWEVGHSAIRSPR